MNENKRFTLREPKVDEDIGCSEIADNGQWVTYGEIVELLNENEQLKSDKELFAQCICNLSNLLCENKIEHNLPKNIEDFISVWGVRIE